ncbi:MAG: hypothetical protein ABIA04_12280 [Pseudomonadota bacterium]
MAHKTDNKRRDFLKKSAKSALLLPYLVPTIETMMIEKAFAPPKPVWIKGISCPKNKVFNTKVKSCVCPPALKWDPGKGVCTTLKCPANYVWNGSYCEKVKGGGGSGKGGMPGETEDQKTQWGQPAPVIVPAPGGGMPGQEGTYNQSYGQPYDDKGKKDSLFDYDKKKN